MAAKRHRCLVCEWMHTDVATGLVGISALARYNPLRWSGPIFLDECIKQLEEARNKSDGRITVIVGTSSKENTFSDIASAIAFVEDIDPVRRGRTLEAQQLKIPVNNCEWMLADVATGLIGVSALARYNPLRWSGAIPFDECIKQLEEALKKSDGRITVKVPAGISSNENIFSDIASAIAFVEDSDPVRRGRKVEEGIRQEAEQAELLRQAMKEERINRANENIVYYDAILTETAKNIEELNAEKAGKTAATAAAKDPDCEWMFGDLAWGAKLNPIRWSGKQSFDVAVDKLEAEKKTEDRPIIVKVPAGPLSPENRFPDCQAAIDFIKNNCPKHLTEQAEEVEVALQNAMKTMDDAKEKLQECRDELQGVDREVAGRS